MVVLDWIITVALVFLGIQYLLGPLLVWWYQKFPEKYEFELLDPEEFLASQGDRFLKLHNEILTEGFYYVGSSVLNMSNSSTNFSIYYHPQLTLCCTLSSIFSQPMSTTQIEFTQLYEDGRVLNINNNPLFGIYPSWHKKISYRFPNVNNFAELLGIAKKLVASKITNSPKKALQRGSEFCVVEEHLTEELLRLVSLGWMSRQVKHGERRLTLLGAILMTWQLCWPVKKLLSMKDEKFALNALDKA